MIKLLNENVVGVIVAALETSKTKYTSEFLKEFISIETTFAILMVNLFNQIELLHLGTYG